ncbi:MAG: lytic transglycosylase domain-containing protein, partial [Myxococcales bacterium]|nr:lytic transglycosylase domain-containing protein [Myxococcales bacterium]
MSGRSAWDRAARFGVVAATAAVALGAATGRAAVAQAGGPSATGLGAESTALARLRSLEETWAARDRLRQSRFERGAPTWADGLWLPDIPIRWDARTVRYLEYFRDDPRGHRAMAEWIARSTRYARPIEAALAAQGLPRDLRCVPMVESAYEPTARSDRGAAGLWQLMAPTAAAYGAGPSFWVDPRLDPRRSSEAAARLLRDLHTRFGSWELALSAYHMGYVSLLRAMRRYNTNDYETLASIEAGLPYETPMYVSKIAACMIVLRNLDRFGFAGVEQAAPRDVEWFSVPGGLRLEVLDEAAGLEEGTLASYNPALIRGRTPPGRERWSLRVPPGAAEALARRWGALE